MASSVPETPPLIPPTASSQGSGVWIGLAVTGALTLGALTTGVLAIRAKNDFDHTIGTPGITPDNVSSARSKTHNWALATDILGGMAIVAGGITVVLVLNSSHGAATTETGWRLRVTPSSAQVDGVF